jgi:hypothetical protein
MSNNNNVDCLTISYSRLEDWLNEAYTAGQIDPSIDPSTQEYSEDWYEFIHKFYRAKDINKY